MVDGPHYQGEDSTGDGVTGTVAVVEKIDQAATAIGTVSVAVSAACTATGVVRWFNTAR